MSMCYCGQSKSFSTCCEPYLLGVGVPETAEILMRSRYSAFATKNASYIQSTMVSPALDRFDLATYLIDETVFTGLTVLSAELGGRDDCLGYVQFLVAFKSDSLSSQISTFTETSTFIKENGRWYYQDGDVQV